MSPALSQALLSSRLSMSTVRDKTLPVTVSCLSWPSSWPVEIRSRQDSTRGAPRWKSVFQETVAADMLTGLTEGLLGAEGGPIAVVRWVMTGSPQRTQCL